MKNQHEITGETVKVIVPHKKSGEEFTFTIDTEDLPIVDSKASWGMDKNKTSAVANFRQDKKMCKATMHRLLTGWKNVNFADGDRFNLRRSNMVEADQRKRRREAGQYLKGNEYRVSGDTVYVHIDNPKRKGMVLIDREDLDLVKLFTWNLNPVTGYAQSKTREGREKAQAVYMHRIIMGAEKGDDQIDHIDRNRLNNKKNNLRFVTWSENQLNRGLPKNNITGFRGVSVTSRNMFEAQMKVMEKTLRKTFETFEEAKTQRLAWENEYGIPSLYANN